MSHPDETTYHGSSDPQQCEYEVWVEETFRLSSRNLVWVEEGLRLSKLDPRLDLVNHSPTGLSWGYAGSGPAQCALAILAHATGDGQQALRLHQQYKAAVVAHLPRDWKLSRSDVLNWVRNHELDAVKARHPRWEHIQFSYGRWTSTHENYDVSYEGPEDGYVSNGLMAEGRTLTELEEDMTCIEEEHNL